MARLFFSLDQKLLGDRFTLNYITGVGVSYFKGRGFFVDDDSESEARLTLWLIPVDFGSPERCLLTVMQDF